MNKELVCRWCGHNMFVTQVQMIPVAQQFPGDNSMRVEVFPAGAEMSPPLDPVWVHAKPHYRFVCVECSEEGITFKFQE